ncbi:unnamed protein product, partial [Linum tenue]
FGIWVLKNPELYFLFAIYVPGRDVRTERKREPPPARYPNGSSGVKKKHGGKTRSDIQPSNLLMPGMTPKLLGREEKESSAGNSTTDNKFRNDYGELFGTR